jgi:hypothetical protein
MTILKPAEVVKAESLKRVEARIYEDINNMNKFCRYIAWLSPMEYEMLKTCPDVVKHINELGYFVGHHNEEDPMENCFVIAFTPLDTGEINV